MASFLPTARVVLGTVPLRVSDARTRQRPHQASVAPFRAPLKPIGRSRGSVDLPVLLDPGGGLDLKPGF